MHSRERVAMPALSENTALDPEPEDAKAFVLSIDATAKFFHYGPQGCRTGFIVGDGWETSITWSQKQAWKNAAMQLQSRRRPPESVKTEQVELTPGGMYPKVTDAEGHTLHSPHCKAAFSRRDPRCHRCSELLHGRPPRDGWQKPFFAKKLRERQKVLLFPNDAA